MQARLVIIMIQNQKFLSFGLQIKETAMAIEKDSSVDGQFRCEYGKSQSVIPKTSRASSEIGTYRRLSRHYRKMSIIIPQSWCTHLGATYSKCGPQELK